MCGSAGKDEARGQLDSALQDVNVRYAVLEETEKRAVCRALIEERARYCSFVTMLKPVLVSAARVMGRIRQYATVSASKSSVMYVCVQDHEINMLGEVTHLQTILEDLTNLTAEPHKLPPASEQVPSSSSLCYHCHTKISYSTLFFASSHWPHSCHLLHPGDGKTFLRKHIVPELRIDVAKE